MQKGKLHEDKNAEVEIEEWKIRITHQG